MEANEAKNLRWSNLDNQAWNYYLRFYRGVTGKIGLSVGLSFAQSFFVLPIAFLIQYEIDELIPSANFSLMVLVGLVIVLLYLFSGGVNLWTRYIILDISKLVIQRIRDELLKKYYTFSRSYYSRTDRSRLHTIMVQDTERLDVMTNAIFSQLLPGIFSSLVLSIVLIYLNGFLYLILLVSMPALALISKTIGRRVRGKTLDFHRSFEKFSQGIIFVLYMMDLTRLQTAEGFEIDKQSKYFEDLRLTSAQMAWLKSAHNLIQNAVIGVAGVIILIVGGYAVARDFMTLGALLSFTAVVALLRPQLQMVTTAIPTIIQGNESLNTLYRQMTSSEVRPYSGIKRIDFQGLISLQSVSFRYKDLPTLVDITLSLNPGEMVALVGPNGSGKTTIVNLILGFYRPEEGRLFADEIPYEFLDIVDLRRKIGVVPQNPLLFHGSVLENITYGNKGFSHAEVEKAAQFALADEFIDQLPDGYGTHIGEYGVLLSGGQSQRIALARAIIRRPKLLVLDEPTNHLETAAVSTLLDNLRSTAPFPACLLISHDMKLANVADRILLIEAGSLNCCVNDFAEINNLEGVKDGMRHG